MSFGVKILPETLRVIDSATFTGAYQTIGSALTHPACLVKFVNDSNVLVTVSWDGINDHDILPQNSFALYDITSDTQREEGLYIAEGTQFYVKGAVGAGSVYLVVLYPSES